MSNKYFVLFLLLLFCLITNCSSYFDTKPDDHCFCKLNGHIDDCSCTVDTVDYFNNVKIYPILKSLLETDYFRFYKINLKRDCPFWSDDSRCAMRYCHIEYCDDKSIPVALKGAFKEHTYKEAPTDKYTEEKTNCENDHNEELSYLNTTISEDTFKEFELWREHDDAKDNFCVEQDDNNGDAEYVDLLLNPERYTGYRGESAHRIWKTIYKENCFRPQDGISSYIHSSTINELCLEKRVFYRVVSGLHTSINIHLCANYLLSESEKNLNFVAPSYQWGPNLAEFKRRFDPSTTTGEGPQWLRNLYFVYLLELRAIEKASNYLENHVDFYSGNDKIDENVRLAIKDLISIVRKFPHHFNDSIMFNGGYKTKKLKEEFRQHFRNISQIMDCVGCDKCKLWGKLQTQGLGTALKILFSGKFDKNVNEDETDLTKNHLRLKRGEIVSLFNGLGRLSSSIYELEQFRQMFR